MGPRSQAASATHSVGPTPKQQYHRSLHSKARQTGDYLVLKQNVEKDRWTVQQARVQLATSLDQLGEHHVRQEEYDDAMDAFSEALREKKSVYTQLTATAAATSLGKNSSLSSSLLSGTREDDAMSAHSGNGDPLAGHPEEPATTTTVSPDVQHDRAIDEIIITLRNMGNVHSLRGEPDEAMRYFTEVTNLRAQKITADYASVVSGGVAYHSSNEARSMLSGLYTNDDTSTLMSEINEDVKALDDLFRSISFRQQAVDKSSVCSASSEKRKSAKAESANRTKRRKGSVITNSTLHPNGGGASVAESSTAEPFKRARGTIASSLPSAGNEISDAIETYRTAIEQIYEGPRLVQHREMLNSLTLRAEIVLGGGGSAASETQTQETSKSQSDLELALEIYSQVLVAHQETQQAKQSQESATASTDPSSEPVSLDEHVASIVASTMISMGSIYYKLGNRVEELQLYKQAKDVYSLAYGEQHIFVAGTRKNIGMVMAEKGEYEAAMQQFEKAMKIYLAINGGSDLSRDVASAMSCMGNVKNRVGELESALEKYMEAFRIYKSVYQLEHESSSSSTSSVASPPTATTKKAEALRDVTSTLKLIGMVHAKMGDLEKAMEYFQEALVVLRSPEMNTAYGRDTMASVLTRIASIHLKSSQLDEAMSYYKEAYDLTVQNHGTTNHAEVANILHSIGGIFHKRSDYDEALACYQESIRIYHATLGPASPSVAGTLVMVGSIYYKRRNLDSALMFYREALRLNRDTYGLHHPDVAPILKSIGTILTKKGEYQEAYDVFRDVLTIKQTVHGPDHPEVASAYKSLGNVYYKLGDLADAERQYRHALGIYRKTKGEEHADTVAAKTTIDHLRYWMQEREQKRNSEQRHGSSSNRTTTSQEHRS